MFHSPRYYNHLRAINCNFYLSSTFSKPQQREIEIKNCRKLKEKCSSAEIDSVKCTNSEVLGVCLQKAGNSYRRVKIGATITRGAAPNRKTVRFAFHREQAGTPDGNKPNKKFFLRPNITVGRARRGDYARENGTDD